MAKSKSKPKTPAPMPFKGAAPPFAAKGSVNKAKVAKAKPKGKAG